MNDRNSHTVSYGSKGATMSHARLVLEDVSVTFRVLRGWRRTSVHAVQNVSLTLEDSSTLALIGESGSGKTTITNAMLGLTKISSGRIQFGDTILCDAAAGKSRATHQAGIQVVMQDPLSSFNPRYRLFSSMSMPLRLKGVKDKDELRDRLGKLSRRVGIAPEQLDKYPHQLSGGQLQRLSIARAISVSPQLIIADEPASKLDVSVRAQVLNLLKDIIEESEMSLLLITHDLDVARFLCKEVAVMHFGKILETGRTQSVFDNPSHNYTQRLLAGGSTVESSGAPSGTLRLINP
ncbi:ABC transporter ATP-binding protein [Burkholderia cenocepacia]|nr:ABC transporter ATP-binding protein [Burkholderia cenocepacia]RQZ83545.1 ABC transporter ATP-binding protein [Burkholderia cenocepacia]RRA04051.1 ABC transporter ATP-binding protein [Burkholderia cenocepacia]